ncbi:MAG: HAMP domain-containing sensor histidine kinase [Candidatus Woesearchaeota archaeon]
MIKEFISTYLNPDIFSSFFLFLNTQQGILFERSIELVIFTILAYMVISEYIRSKRKELRYFILAFGALFLLRLASVVLNLNIVFGHVAKASFDQVLPVSTQFLELFTLVLLINAFLYPIISKKIKNMNFFIIYEILMLALVSILVQMFWLYHHNILPLVDFRLTQGNLIFIWLKIAIICFALYLIIRYKNIKFNYRRHVFVAFSIYLLTPLIQLFNSVFFEYDAQRLILLEIPFPLISILLFTQIIYLKLVDKAYLREKLEESQKRYKAERELSKLKDEFVSVVSHELRTPLTSMKLYCDLLHSEKFGKITNKQHEAIHVIESECDRLNVLINDILNLSKLESGKDKINLGYYCLDDLKKMIVDRTAREKGIEVDYDIPKGFEARVDVEKFKQMYINLFSNAVKFTEKGGRISVIVKVMKDKWKLILKDTGIGMPKNEVPRLFDKFYQIDSHMTRKFGGTGLGLAIVKAIVDLHIGNIEVKSEIGKGSTFIVTFPKNL